MWAVNIKCLLTKIQLSQDTPCAYKYHTQGIHSGVLPRTSRPELILPVHFPNWSWGAAFSKHFKL